MRSKRGITLVSLVVTIIVLIILAGVSINLTLGENGIITMAKRARENMELAKVDEERQLNELYAQIVTEGGSSGNVSEDAIIRLVEFKREIASAITDMGIKTEENADASTMSNNIRSLTGTSSADKVTYDNTNSNLAATNIQGAVDEIDTEIDELNDSLGSLYPCKFNKIADIITVHNLGKSSSINELKTYMVTESGYYRISLYNNGVTSNKYLGYCITLDGNKAKPLDEFLLPAHEYSSSSSQWIYYEAGETILYYYQAETAQFQKLILK